jgi:CRISPR/Cas system CMR-associated protein Cmr5 small subunit
MGQAKLRTAEINILKSQLIEVSLCKYENFEIVEILDLNQKKSLMTKYKSAYTGQLKRISDMNLYRGTVRFIAAKVNDEIAGFIRINDKSSFFPASIHESIWNITDGFTESHHRGKGVLRTLIQYATKNLSVKMFYMEELRYAQWKNYYVELGFTRYVSSTDGLMIWGVLEEMHPQVPNSRAAHQNDFLY